MVETTVIDGDCPIHVEMHGAPNAPCVVLLLGLGMRVAEWPEPIIHDLAQDFRVLCIENRDMGLSGRCGPDHDQGAVALLTSAAQGCVPPREVPYTLFDMRDDVLRCLDQLGIVRFAVVGFSMGGMIAQSVAASCPSRVTCFAQICSSAGEATPPFSDDTWGRFLRTSQPFENEDALLEWLAEDFAWFSAPVPVSTSQSQSAARSMIAGGFTPGGYARQLLALSCSGDRRRQLSSIRCPSLVIGAEEDRCIPAESSIQANKQIQNSILSMCQEAGHTLDAAAVGGLVPWLRSKLTLASAPYAEEHIET